uniref:IS21 family transposase n=1 Tax=Bacteroides neonati TaxID=1347393 RepID=UPI0004B5FE8C
MITMVEKQAIIHMYRTVGYSKRAIARELDISRKTVHKVIAEYEAALNCPDPESSLESILTIQSRYDSSKRSRRIITGSLKDLIDDCLEKNTRKRAMGLKKQCMRGKDIYELLIDKGFEVSYTGVCKYIASVAAEKKEDKSQEAFIRGYYPPGESCEFDWGEVKLYLNGKLQRIQMAVFTLSHSNGRYAWLFHHQDQLAFMESHRNFFRQIKGVPSIMVYDNMRVAIKKFAGQEKKPTETLLRMSNFYRYHYRFCNARAGWEKGHVERSVEYVRRKAFSVNLHYASLKDAQIHLLAICEKINSRSGSPSTINKVEDLAADLAALRPYTNEMGCFQMAEYKVDKWSTICMNCSHYSVPDTLVGKMVTVKLYSEKIVILYNNEKVSVHERIYSRQKGWSIKLEHYLNTLLRKPGALHTSLALKQMPGPIQTLFNKHFTDKARDFVFLLQYARENNFSDSDIIEAYASLKARGLRSISADQIKVMLYANNESQVSQGEPIYPDDNHKSGSAMIEEGAMRILMDLSRIMDAENNIKIITKN